MEQQLKQDTYAQLSMLREFTATLMTQLEHTRHGSAPLARAAWEIAYDLADGMPANMREATRDVEA